jgi:chromosomal replication initiator protein
MCSGRFGETVSPLYIHGPTGTGKTHLVSALCDEVSRRAPGLSVARYDAEAIEGLIEAAHRGSAQEAEALSAARSSDLVVLEDLQRLGQHSGGCRPFVLEALVLLLDSVSARQRLMLITAQSGPSRLAQLSWRLVTRISSGLVLGIEPLQAESRLQFLKLEAQRRQLAVGSDVLAWLASRLTGGARQLEGAIAQLEGLTRLEERILDLATVRSHFQPQTEAGRPTAERIAQRVGSFFHMQARQLQSRRRYQNILLPRQISMYLARSLTSLSLKEIGAYFGGRDHSTVLHACRKIEQDLGRDPALSGIVRQLRADLA